MERARSHLVDHRRRQVLAQRVHTWQEAEAIRAYCDAVEARHGIEAICADGKAAEWLALARANADQLQALPTMPAAPAPTPEALKPFLGGWSPYGPRGPTGGHHYLDTRARPGPPDRTGRAANALASC